MNSTWDIKSLMISKKKTRMPKWTRALIGVLLVILLAGARYMSAVDPPQSVFKSNPDSLMTVAMLSSKHSQIIDYEGFRVSFNDSLHIPNWVAWELTNEETNGTTARENKFWSDKKVNGCPETYDYSYSGYDRGHMCPAGDMKWNRDAMHCTFSLANICPQAKSLNTGAWKKLEEKCRRWANADSAIIIVCGPILTDHLRETIGDSRVAVPERFFKVVLSPHVKPIRGIGFIMKNGKVTGGMQAAAVSIDSVERATGLDFYASLPDSIEEEVEAQCDFPGWSIVR